MSLSVSPAARAQLRDALFCLSLGSLCFVRRWFDLEVLQVRSLDYYRSGPRDWTLLSATLIGSCALALVFWGLGQLVRRLDNPRLTALARCAVLLLMAFPLESMRRYWITEFGNIGWTSSGILVGIELALMIGAGMATVGNLHILRAGRTMLLLAAPLLPVMLWNFIWGHPQTEPAAFQSLPGLPMLPPRPVSATHAAPRVVWLLFDEFDQHLAFDQRPPSLRLPELDRLRAESVVANRMIQTANKTVVAIPSMLSGSAFESAGPSNARTLLVRPPGWAVDVDWRKQPNVFQQARNLGANTSLVGWQHPYCRVIGDSLVHCFDLPGGHPADALLREFQASEDGVWKTVLFQYFMQLENLLDLFRPDDEAVSPDVRDAFVQRRQLRHFLAIRDHAYREITDPRMDLVFVHFPTPHMFAIYDRNRKDFALSPDTTYLDNLALVDRTVGEVRHKLEQSGLWDSTTLIITSDHAFRPAMWRNRYNWTPEFEKLMAQGASRTVPFILKLAGQHEGAVYEPSLSNMVAGELSVAVLSGQVRTPQQATAWLSDQSAQATISER